MASRLGVWIPLVAIAASVSVSARQDFTRSESTRMQRKLDAVVERSTSTTAKATVPLRTSFTERELNAYFQFDGKDQLPTGLVKPRIALADAGRLEGRALVDLDAVRLSKPRTMLDPANLLRGSVEIWVSGRLVAANGQGTFQLQSATLGGVPLGKSLLQILVGYYSRTPSKPDGYDMDQPFPLPAAIRAVETRPGAATIIQ